ncbi:MAG: hypothetical protein GY863_20755 [bacterium]|nr:hypothetical protein [bacterium]
MKKILLITVILFINCTSSIYLQPHLGYNKPQKTIDNDAGIYIPPEDLTFEHKKFNFLMGENVRVPLGTPLKDLSQETFAPFFRRVFYLGAKNFDAAENIIELSIVEFRVTEGLDSHLVLKCEVSEEDRIIFSEVFKGSGKGYAAAGFLDNKSWAREQIRKSAEAAFIEAFSKIQTAFNDYLAQYRSDKYPF